MPADRKIGEGESLQVRPRPVILIMGTILVVLTGLAFGLTLLFHDRIGSRAVTRNTFPAPAVVPDERAARLAMDARQRRLLNGADGRLPINQAMAEIAGRGAHAFDPVQP